MEVFLLLSNNVYPLGLRTKDQGYRSEISGEIGIGSFRASPGTSKVHRRVMATAMGVLASTGLCALI
jgi:hypothetical protein